MKMEYYYSNKGNKRTPSPRGRAGVGIKVCGMKRNTTEVAALKPDYLGFIFWKNSKRYFKGPMVPVPHTVKKVGVFVDAPIKTVIERIQDYDLLLVQLHGKETPEYCAELREKVKHVQIIKVFSIKDDFDFKILKPYEDVCDFYLFDTKGKLPGGNGFAFDWKVLENYPSTKPYFLSGGIGLEEMDSIKAFLQRPESKYCHALDVNSRFEVEPGLKDVGKLEEFKSVLTL